MIFSTERIAIFTDEFFNKIDPLSELLKKAGFKILEIKKNKNDFKVYFMGECPVDVTGYTVFAWNYSKMIIEKTQFAHKGLPIKKFKYLVAFPTIQLVDTYDELKGFDSI